MELSKIIAKLHPLERSVLPILKKEKELPKIVHKSKLQEIEIMRALQWLENKELLKINTTVRKLILLDKNGKNYKEQGLPEKLFLQVLSRDFKGMNVIKKKTRLSKEEINACLGILKREKAIEIKKEEGLLHAKITTEGEDILSKPFIEEEFLQQEFPIEINSIVDKETMNKLKKRKEFLKFEEKKDISIKLTELGLEIIDSPKLKEEVINRLSKQMLRDASWKNKKFRAYDIEINVPKINSGKTHFVNEAVDYIKKIWLEMGFKEMTGNYVQSAFWDLDALFVPQDHPAREMQDTFYVKGKAKLPELWKKIKEVHENGGDTESKGWQYKFSEEETKKILLRTHTTVLSAQTISKLKKEDLPAKYFSVGKVFRNEALDWKHLFEFYQVEGIVIDPSANLKHLKGYLTQFYKKMGFEKVRMRPAHFPYTEPSLEIDVFHPVKKEWVELGGAGIFRPEVVIPLLGFDCPVLAWGQGMGRIISEYWKITDIRDLYKNDVKQIREMKTWLK
jgi:phenylalanyl-tRNA synthetase alpha chain